MNTPAADISGAHQSGKRRAATAGNMGQRIGGVMPSHLPEIDVLEIAEEALQFVFAQVNRRKGNDEGLSADE